MKKGKKSNIKKKSFFNNQKHSKISGPTYMETRKSSSFQWKKKTKHNGTQQLNELKLFKKENERRWPTRSYDTDYRS